MAKDINQLPLILCGPIVRRVEPKEVTIWVALKESATVELSVWRGVMQHSQLDEASGDFIAKTAQDTVHIGAHLHVIAVHLPLNTVQELDWGQLYSYNLKLTTTNGVIEDFNSLGLLGDANNDPVITYDLGHLPSFVLPADVIEDLKVIHGSCRNNNNDYEDGLSWVDDLILQDRADPTKRPQQLFLSGDQVYADSVAGPLLNELGQWGPELLNNQETLPTEWKKPVTGEDRWPADLEHFPPNLRDRLIDSEARFTTDSKANHLITFGEFASMYLSVWAKVLWDPAALQNFEEIFDAMQTVPDNFGAIFRRHLTDERSGKMIDLESGDQTFRIPAGDLFENTLLQNMLEFLLVTLTKPELKALFTGEGEVAVKNAAIAKHDNFFQPITDPIEKAKNRHLYQYFKDFIGDRYKDEDGYTTQENRILIIHQTLHKVRRALANISTYMIFDDHEVTDDWNLNPAWRRRVFTSPLGKSIIRNGMLTYAIFQDWGNRAAHYNREGDFFDLTDLSLVNEFNLETLTPPIIAAFQNNGKGVTLDPAKTTVKLLHTGEWLVEDIDDNESILVRTYTIDEQDILRVLRNPHAYMLSQIPRLFTETGNTLAEVEETLDFILGLDIHHEVVKTTGGRYQAPDNRSPLIKWHYTFQGAKHRVLVIDNRTRRSYVSLAGAPGNLSFNGMSDLIPNNPQVAPDEVTFVVAPLPVIGPSVLDELVAPMAFKTYDMLAGFENKEAAKIHMIGTDPDAIEAWAFDPVSMEELLKRLAPFERIIFLSGDVHYGSSQRLHYWRKGVSEPSCFAQLTSSGMRNVMPTFIQYISQHFGFAQKLIRRKLRAERLGWHEKEPKPLDFGENKPNAFLKHHLDKSPVIIPNLGWPDDTSIAAGRDPDWSWRAHDVWDERPENERPTETRLESISGDPEEKTIDALRKVASRHIAQAKKINFTRQILFKANIGLVTFEKQGDTIHVLHNMYAVGKNGKKGKIQQQQLYTLHKIALATTPADQPPTLHQVNSTTHG